MSKRIYKIFIFAVFASFWFGGTVSASNIKESCTWNSNTICTGTIDDLPANATGIDPGKNVQLTFYVTDKATATKPPTCSSGEVRYAVKHLIDGRSDLYDYPATGTGNAFTYDFNSGTDSSGQRNRYLAYFYCNTSVITDKSGIDTIVGLKATQNQAWTTPEFNLNTSVTTINPDCAKITSCANYPVRNDCTGNRCKLSPSCQWVNNSCASISVQSGVTTTQKFQIKNPIGATDFQDLINIIGRWIFNLAIPVAVIMIIYAGIMMLTAGDNPGRFQKGTQTLKYAVIGLAIVLIGRGFVTLIKSILDLGK